MKFRYLTDKEIEQGKRDAIKKYGDEYPKGTGKSRHVQNDCIRTCYAWLDAQITTDKLRSINKNLPESWGNMYVSASDIIVAGLMHPKIENELLDFNIGKALVFPSIKRLEDMKENVIWGGDSSINNIDMIIQSGYKKIEVLEDSELEIYNLPIGRYCMMMSRSYTKLIAFEPIAEKAGIGMYRP